MPRGERRGRHIALIREEPLERARLEFLGFDPAKLNPSFDLVFAPELFGVVADSVAGNNYTRWNDRQPICNPKGKRGALQHV